MLMATHDPILALMGDRRILIRNGGIEEILRTSPEEKEILLQIENMDKKIPSLADKTSEPVKNFWVWINKFKEKYMGLHDGCSGNFETGQATVDKVRAMGFSDPVHACSP